jgi:general secretion pathway protein G
MTDRRYDSSRAGGGARCPHCDGELPATFAPVDRGGGSSFTILLVVLILGAVVMAVVLVGFLAWFALRTTAQLEREQELQYAEEAMVREVMTQEVMAQQALARSELAALRTALEQYAVMNGGRYPHDLEALMLPDENGAALLEGWEFPVDPWGAPYRYDPPGPDRAEPRVYTYGADGLPGGEGEDADLFGDDR